MGRRNGLKIRWWFHRVGSNPISSTKYAGVAKLANALDLGSSGSDTLGVQFPSPVPLNGKKKKSPSTELLGLRDS